MPFNFLYLYLYTNINIHQNMYLVILSSVLNVDTNTADRYGQSMVKKLLYGDVKIDLSLARNQAAYTPLP